MNFCSKSCLGLGFSLPRFTHFSKFSLWGLWAYNLLVLILFWYLLQPLLKSSSFLSPHFLCSCAQDSFFWIKVTSLGLKKMKMSRKFVMQTLQLNYPILYFTVSLLNKIVFLLNSWTADPQDFAKIVKAPSMNFSWNRSV